MTRAYHFISRFASLGLATVLLLLAAFIVWASVATHAATTAAEATAASSDALQLVRYDVAQETSLQRAYWLRHDPGLRAGFYRTANALTVALARQRRAGGPGDPTVIVRVAAQQQSYLHAARRLFAAVESGNTGRALWIESRTITPLLAVLEPEVDAAAGSAERAASARLQSLDHVEGTVGSSALVLFSCGLFLVVVFSSALRTYRRRVAEAMQVELMRLTGMALSDTLTELGNHRAFQEALHHELAQARRQGTTVVLALVDVDEFKALNDQHGHVQGDRVLSKLAIILRGGRAGDRAFRLGGDEFALILPHTTLCDAVTVTERLRLEAEESLGGATVSIGLAVSTPRRNEDDLLREEAAAAVGEAKRRGRNAVVTFDEIRDSASIVSAAKAQTVRRLIAERCVTVAFQPIWDLNRGVILAFEALTRPAATYGLAGPLEAFDIAERIGRAHELDDVCRQAILARARELPGDALLFLNVSPQALDHDHLAGATLVRAVEAAGLPPSRVVLEITERSLARLEVVVREAKRLQGLGFRLALDDVGAGNAGLEVLRQLPVDFVKIDRDVIAGALTDRTARAVLAAVIAFAREAHSRVIAEGIETADMLDLVRGPDTSETAMESGVHAVQGYLLGRPSEVLPDVTTIPVQIAPTHAA